MHRSSSAVRTTVTVLVAVLVAFVSALATVPRADAAPAATVGTVVLSKDATADLPGVDDPRWKKLTPAQQQEALKAARQAAGQAVCGNVPVIKSFDKTKNKCAELVSPLFTVAKTIVPIAICTDLENLPGVGLAFRLVHCSKVLKGLIEGKGWDAFKGTLIEKIVNFTKTVIKAVKFVVNPMGALDDLSNSSKESATGLTSAVLKNMAAYDNASLSSPQFRADYAKSAGLGLVVLAIMFLLSCWHAARGKIDSDELVTNLAMRAPMAVFLITMGPVIGWALQDIINGLTTGVATAAGGNVDQFLAKTFAVVSSVTSTGLPGGALPGLLLFLAIIVGAFGILLNFIMQNFGMYMTSAVLAIAFGMRIHPGWRPKVRKVEAGWGALLLMKPLFMLLLGFAFGFLNMTVSGQGNAAEANSFHTLVSLVTIAAVFLTLAFVPFGIFKYAPLLPAGNEADAVSSSGAGAMLAGAAGGTLSQVAMQRSAAGRGGGTATPAAQPTSTPPAPNQPNQPGKPGEPGEGGRKPDAAKTPEATPTRQPQAGGSTRAPAAGKAGQAGQTGAQATKAGGSAAKAGGTAAAGAATGGVALAAGMALSGGAQMAQAAKQKAHQLSDSGGPRMREAEEE